MRGLQLSWWNTTNYLLVNSKAIILQSGEIKIKVFIKTSTMNTSSLIPSLLVWWQFWFYDLPSFQDPLFQIITLFSIFKNYTLNLFQNCWWFYRTLNFSSRSHFYLKVSAEEFLKITALNYSNARFVFENVCDFCVIPVIAWLEKIRNYFDVIVLYLKIIGYWLYSFVKL